MKKSLLFISSLIFTGCSVFGVRSVSEPDYILLLKENHIEIRQYNDIIVAQTEGKGNYKESSSESFRRLFGYISGKRKSQ